MGKNIGERLIDEFLAKSRVECTKSKRSDIKEVADLIAKTGFKMFLGVTATVPSNSWNAEGNEFSILLEDNPLIEFVELPEEHNKLWYSNIICGIIESVLEMIQMEVQVRQVRCPLKGDDCTEFRVVYVGGIEEKVPAAMHE